MNNLDEKSGSGLEPAGVSVVIPAYNSAATLERAVRSVALQTLRPLEVIIVDDASTDETVAVAGQLSKEYSSVPVSIIRHEKNMGPASARNTGWGVASGRYIAFLDADDIWHPEKIRLQYEWMMEHPEYALSGHTCIEMKDGDEFPQLQEVPRVLFPTRWQFLLSNQFSTPSVMLKRELACRFQDGKRYAEDYLLWLQIILDGEGVACIKQTLAAYLKPAFGGGGLSGKLWAMEKGELETYRRLFHEGRLNIVIWSLLSVYSLVKFLKRVVGIVLKKIMDGRKPENIHIF
jgi:glycosyltransferase involved in cell wall biosynthesis